MPVSVGIDQVAAVIVDLLNDYGKDVSARMREEVDAMAHEAAQEIYEGAPKRTGRYAGGWAADPCDVVNGSNQYTRVVANKTKPGLAHLLENGHATQSGGRVEGIPHIRPVYDNLQGEMPKRMKRAIEGVS
jgi:hypothetical protein